MNEKLVRKIEQCAQKTQDYFYSHLDERGGYKEDQSDISAYYKVPMMLVYAGKNDLARKVLMNIKNRFMAKDGDFLSSAGKKSIKPEYIEFWTYTNGWILRAANAVGLRSEFDSAFDYMSTYFSHAKPYLTGQLTGKNQESDVLTAAHFGLINLEMGYLQYATDAGNFLVDFITDQQNINLGFYLRCNQSEIITSFPDAQQPFYFVDKTKPDQLYFMIGYPSAYLAILYEKTGDKRYLEASKQYMEFALSCHENVFNSNFSHKIAWAASILYKITGEPKYLNAVEKIIDHFASTQSPSGIWYDKADVNTQYDQSAEIACWFTEIARNISNPKPSLAVKDNSSSLDKVKKYGVMALIAGLGIYTAVRAIRGEQNGFTQSLRNPFDLKL